MPVKDLLTRLRAEIDKIQLADSHEHLHTERQRLDAGPNALGSLFAHYASSDLVSAGMSGEDLNFLRDGGKPLAPRLKRLMPYWSAIFNTSYARALKIAARDLYGVELDGEASWKRLCQRYAETNKPGWYHHVLKEMARIDVSLHDVGNLDTDRAFFVPIVRFDNFVGVRSRPELDALVQQSGVSIHTLDALLQALDKEFEKAIAAGAVGVKTGLAYQRILDYPKVARHDAEVIFNRVLGRHPLDAPGWAEAKPLQDFVMHQVVQRCKEHRLPLQIHTGIQEGNGNDIRMANPTHLIPLFLEYRDLVFDVFHAGYPYSTEVAVMAKNFASIYPDLCWMHAATEFGSRRILHEWLDTVPANKIFAFGGDYCFIEGAYAHAQMAREDVAVVLAEKVEWGHLTEAEALRCARAILRENLMRVYEIEKKRRIGPRSDARPKRRL
jgi:predicted TIM-barrel fold metal-dependent hydrolase